MEYEITLNEQEVEYLQSLFIDRLQDGKLKSKYEEKRLEILLDKLSKL